MESPGEKSRLTELSVPCIWACAEACACHHRAEPMDKSLDLDLDLLAHWNGRVPGKNAWIWHIQWNWMKLERHKVRHHCSLSLSLIPKYDQLAGCRTLLLMLTSASEIIGWHAQTKHCLCCLVDDTGTALLVAGSYQPYGIVKSKPTPIWRAKESACSLWNRLGICDCDWLQQYCVSTWESAERLKVVKK